MGDSTKGIKVSSMQLTSYMPNDSNWQLWRREVIIGMKRISSYNILIGTEHRPVITKTEEDTQKCNDWDQRHDKGYHMLVLSLSEAFKTLTISCDDLPSTWTKLQQHFEGKPLLTSLPLKHS